MKEKGYRFALRMPEEYRAYLQERAWECRATMTEYLLRMIEADAAQHPDTLRAAGVDPAAMAVLDTEKGP